MPKSRPGNNAQPEVKDAIVRFYDEGLHKKKVNLLWWLLGEGTPAFKLTKEQTNYTDQSSREQKCENCEYLYRKAAAKPPRWICSQISGNVKPKGWCDQYRQIKV